MNTLAALAIASAIFAAIMYYTAISLADRNKALQSRLDASQVAGLDLLIQCQALEVYNDYLEARQSRCRALVATSLMFAQSREMRSEKMSIKEGEGMP